MRLVWGALLAVVLAGCAAPTAPEPEPNLFGEYLRSTDVVNDRFPGGGTAEDRMAGLAAYYSADQLLSRLLSAFECGEGMTGGGSFDTSCDLTPAVLDGIRAAGGDADDVHGRVLLVKHADGRLELVTVFVVNDRMIDSNGGTYADLEDFQQNNKVLTADDLMYVPRDITSTSGGSELVTLYGHTRTIWLPWVFGGLGVVLVAGLVLVVVRFRVNRVVEPPESAEF
jgi:hypothetical protein